jgi:PTH1 family peptidyl-tRNA hydrolase
MNNSGEAVRDAMDFYKLSPENVIVISDDTTLLAGSVRVREKGSAGGHNGLKSIIKHLGTDEFMRIRLGVGSKWGSEDLKDFVLENMSSADLKDLCDTFDGVTKALELMMKGDVQRAMALYNKTKKLENKENG